MEELELFGERQIRDEDIDIDGFLVDVDVGRAGCESTGFVGTAGWESTGFVGTAGWEEDGFRWDGGVGGGAEKENREEKLQETGVGPCDEDDEDHGFDRIGRVPAQD